MIIIDKYINKNIFNNVVLWNKRIANNPSKNKEQRKYQIINQLRYLAEEMYEFKEAKECNNIVEMFDAICDIIFVGNYLPRLCHDKSLIKSYRIDLNNIKSPLNELLSLVDNNLSEINLLIKSNLSFKDIKSISKEIFKDCELYVKYFIQYLYSIGYESPLDVYLNVINLVIDTNNNKFLYSLDHANKMLPLVSKRYEGRFENIVVIESHGAYLFRADNGDGKILKPMEWKEPDIKTILNI